MPVENLSRSDIKILNDKSGTLFSEGGGEPEFLVASDNSFYTIITLEMSSSIFAAGVENKVGDAAKSFIKSMVEEKKGKKKHKVALYAFGSTSESGLVQSFTDDHNVLNRKIDEIIAYGARGGCNLYGSYVDSLLTLDYMVPENEVVTSSMIILADGTDEAGTKSELDAIIAKREDVEIYVVGIKGNYDESKIKKLASNSFHYFSSTSDELETTFGKIADIAELPAKSNYIIGLCTSVEAESSFTITAEKEGLIGELTVHYDGESVYGWTGNVSKCDEKELTDPCGVKDCGNSTIPGVSCGTCANGMLCGEDQICYDPCAEKECGSSEGKNCGTCSDNRYCSSDQKCVTESEFCNGKECGTVTLEKGAESVTVVCGKNEGKCSDENFCNSNNSCEAYEEYGDYLIGEGVVKLKSTNQVWLNVPLGKTNLSTASKFCENLHFAGYSDWHLPSISEFRTTIVGCSRTVTGGRCKLTDSCLTCYSYPECECERENGPGENGFYWEAGIWDYRGNEYGSYDSAYFWTSSVRPDTQNNQWILEFNSASMATDSPTKEHYVRCVR